MTDVYRGILEHSRERILREWRISDHLKLMEKVKELEQKAEDWKILAEKQHMERERVRAGKF